MVETKSLYRERWVWQNSVDDCLSTINPIAFIHRSIEWDLRSLSTITNKWANADQPCLFVHYPLWLTNSTATDYSIVITLIQLSSKTPCWNGRFSKSCPSRGSSFLILKNSLCSQARYQTVMTSPDNVSELQKSRTINQILHARSDGMVGPSSCTKTHCRIGPKIPHKRQFSLQIEPQTSQTS